ncbi:hypothetical protein DFS34DRAFT_58620 [Phlyctochytrium arcticum]|nr:hypothetical protein DFS34DRAFT_58620 [Phlyctochytrium arcticum]
MQGDFSPSTPSTPAAPVATGADGEIYAAVYSGIPVYEMMCNGIAVMRRKSDGFLNATQILKVAGVDKGKRTKILDKEVMTGEHEKVQGGYGKYQGTWIPFERGEQLAQMYNVDTHLRPILEFELPLPGRVDQTPTKEQVAAANRDILKKAGGAVPAKYKARAATTPAAADDRHAASEAATPRRRKAGVVPARASKRQLEVEQPAEPVDEELAESGLNSPSASNHYSKKRPRTDNYADTIIETNSEKYRAMLMAMFVNEDPLYIPDMLSGPSIPTDLNLDFVIDEQGHTSLHWAAALARINVVRLLLQKGADIRSVNADGETALIRAVRVTNNYDNQTFPELLEQLSSTLMVVDSRNRTVLHHISSTAGLEGRVAASRYYMECVLEWIARHDGNFSAIVDAQDVAGDTALNIAARIGNRNLVEQLVDVGADASLENKAGLRPADFGFEELVGSRCPERPDCPTEGSMEVDKSEGTSRVVFPSIRTDEEDAALALSAVASATRGREVSTELKLKSLKLDPAVQQMVDDMSCAFSAEMKVKTDQLNESRTQLKQVTKELAEIRKQNYALRKENSMLPEMVQRIKNLERCLGEEIARVPPTEMDVLEMTKSHIYHASSPLNSVNGATGGGTLMAGGMVSSQMDDTPLSQEEQHHEDMSHQMENLRQTLQEKESLERSLRSEIIHLKSTSGQSELGCKKIIAACCKVPVENVDELLTPLLQAVETDKEVDMRAVAGFMMDVKRREGAIGSVAPAAGH